jgi:hypothetical protein
MEKCAECLLTVLAGGMLKDLVGTGKKRPSPWDNEHLGPRNQPLSSIQGNLAAVHDTWRCCPWAFALQFFCQMSCERGAPFVPWNLPWLMTRMDRKLCLCCVNFGCARCSRRSLCHVSCLNIHTGILPIIPLRLDRNLAVFNACGRAAPACPGPDEPWFPS